ncbi:MAG: hypothetical protein R6V42_06695 [Orrella sp.]
MSKEDVLTARDERNAPWWRHRWPWLLMLGPAVAFVGCVITIVLAFQNFSDQAIYDGGVKRGLVVERTGTTTSSSNESQ